MAQSWRQLCEDMDPGLRDSPVAYTFSDGERFYDRKREFGPEPPEGGRLVIDVEGVWVIDKGGKYVFVDL